MRNVDRDVLREAIALADLQDIFTPTFEVELFSKLEELAERNRLLESIAFGTVIVRLFRTTIFLVRLLPSTRAMLIFTAILVALDRVIAHQGELTTNVLRQFASDAGVDDIAAEVIATVQAALDPVLDLLSEAEAQLGDGLLEISREIGTIKGAFGEVERLVRNSQWTTAVNFSEEMQASGFNSINNLTDNLVDLVVIPMGARIQEIRDFDLAQIFREVTPRS